MSKVNLEKFITNKFVYVLHILSHVLRHILLVHKVSREIFVLLLLTNSQKSVPHLATILIIDKHKNLGASPLFLV